MTVLFMGCLFIEQYYVREVIVIDIQDGVVYVTDSTNNVWSYCGDGVEVGQTIKVLMNIECTDGNVSDDSIRKVIK